MTTVHTIRDLRTSRPLLEGPDRARRLGENGRRAVAERYKRDAERGKPGALYRQVA